MSLRVSGGTRRLAVLVLSLAPATCLGSGGGPIPSPVSTSRVRPEAAAMERYLQGKLGILWPSYDRAMLLVAYRTSRGLRGVSDADRERLVQVTGLSSPVLWPDLEAWSQARVNAGGPELPYRLDFGWRMQSEFSGAVNCQPHAFRMATKTLKARQATYAADTAAVQHWLAAQDSVFSYCQQSGSPVPLPELAADAPEWLVKDHAYQHAAVLLYQHQPDPAIEAFSAIAKDPASPWREWAAYLKVRTWWRHTFNVPEDYATFVAQTPELSAHPQVRQLISVGQSAKDPEVKAAAEELRSAIAARHTPARTHRDLWQLAGAAEPVPDLQAWIRDIRFLWAVLKQEDYATDWLFATRSQNADFGEASVTLARERLAAAWNERHEPIVLASLLMGATPTTDGVDDWVQASRKIASDDPLYLHFAYQRARLALTRGDREAARAELTRAAPAVGEASLGTRQAFDQLAMLLAPSLEVLSAHLLRVPVSSETTDIEMEPIFESLTLADPILDGPTQQWLVQQLTGEELLSLSESTTLAASHQILFASEAWRWGAFTQDAALERRAARRLATLTADAPVVAALASDDAEQMRFLMAHRLLEGKVQQLGGFFPHGAGPETAEAHWQLPPAFRDTTEAAKQQSDRERRNGVNTTTWMGEQILPWISAHTDHADAAAILKDLVYASRYGAPDKATSRKAFLLLHKLYPESEEAKSTKYYY
ncbi:hypothetical protein [Tahibacter amnicola]|uniref:DUF4034 domain-containing protein n=1 Tax=Tahibacter amnicola TaxID=2976241 RepID=A0ABY6BKV3_9GAMM|nr:hypothetical protein [Tahibacter amnicola]UXI70102.1 hypothetical protein N4264_10875 [Tahibacter amnicola]